MAGSFLWASASRLIKKCIGTPRRVARPTSSRIDLRAVLLSSHHACAFSSDPTAPRMLMVHRVMSIPTIKSVRSSGAQVAKIRPQKAVGTGGHNQSGGAGSQFVPRDCAIAPLKILRPTRQLAAMPAYRRVPTDVRRRRFVISDELHCIPAPWPGETRAGRCAVRAHDHWRNVPLPRRAAPRLNEADGAELEQRSRPACQHMVPLDVRSLFASAIQTV